MSSTFTFQNEQSVIFSSDEVLCHSDDVGMCVYKRGEAISGSRRQDQRSISKSR